MLFAERHGKLGRNYSRAHERGEDLLTSTAFQLLQYVPAADGLFAVLRRTRSVYMDGGQIEIGSEPPIWLLPLDEADRYELTFWPNWGIGIGQPEVVITLFEGSRPLGRLPVEVKLDSGKSQITDAVAGADTPPRDPDQLSRYYRRLTLDAERDRVSPLGLVYLTAHSAPPIDDLRESLTIQPGGWLGWLSWRDVWTAMKEAGGKPGPAADLAEILALKGFKTFDGFHARTWVPPPPPWSFWQVPCLAMWFATEPPVLPRTAAFWTHQKETRL